MADERYVDYFAVLGLQSECKPGEVRRQYKKLMKDMVIEIARTEITNTLRDQYLLRMAQLNAAFYILRDNALRETYQTDREQVMRLEQEWQDAVEKHKGQGAECDTLRRSFDQAVRNFLSLYMEELMLRAGRDKDCVEASHWDMHHERHAGRILRHHRQQLYHKIHELLPFYDVSKPEIDWDSRAQLVQAVLSAEKE